jgi:pimeloyl-ACP methyl ester carboxylesterase
LKAYRKEINGIELYYEYYHHSPEGKTIVLIHGFLSSTFSFRRLHPFLKQDFNIVSIDLPPFGKSGKSTRFNYSYENVAKTVISLIESLQLKDVILIGHSLGGQLCLHISHIRPDFADKSILLCSSAYLKRPKTSLVLLSYLPFFHIAVKKQLARSGLLENLQKVVYDHSLIDDEMMSGYLQPFLEEDIFRALTRMIRDRENDLSGQQLKEINTPCLLIWGEHDRVVPLSVGNQLHQDLKNSKLIVLKETGHLVPEERPEDVFVHIRNFVLENHVS